MTYLNSLPRNKQSFLHEIWGEQAWFLRAYSAGGGHLNLVLQRKPYSGKIPGREDVYEKRNLPTGPHVKPLTEELSLRCSWMESVVEGNPGAARVLNELKTHLKAERKLTFESALFWLLANDITGPVLWKVYKDHNHEDIEQVADKLVQAWSPEPLPYSPDNFMIHTDMPREEVEQDPLRRLDMRS